MNYVYPAAYYNSAYRRTLSYSTKEPGSADGVKCPKGYAVARHMTYTAVNVLKAGISIGVALPSRKLAHVKEVIQGA